MGLFSKKPKDELPVDTVKQADLVSATNSVELEGDESVAPVIIKPKKKKVKRRYFNFFASDIPSEKPLADPDFEYRRYLRLTKRVRFEATAIAVLIVVFVFATHLFKDEHRYLARRIGAPVGSEKTLSGLTIPVLTKDAINSWAMTAVTEILTFNFSNYNKRISEHAWRFHPDGWNAFVKAMYEANTLQEFKSRQLVSTAAPAGSAIIESEGINEETQEYEWKVKVPVIRKYITNNDRSDVKKLDVILTLVRVPLTSSAAGMGIKVWREQ